MSMRLKTLLAFWGVLTIGSLALRHVDAAEAVRYEFAAQARFSSTESTQDHYVINGDASPGIHSRTDADYHDMRGEFSFFFAPIPEQPAAPFALRRFYAHPSALHFSFGIEPEHTVSYEFENPTISYSSLSNDHDQSRQAGFDGVFYLLKNTGLIMRINSIKDESASSDISPFAETQSRSESDEIRRNYGIGMSRYLAENVAITGMYSRLDYEFVSMEKSWKDNPLLFTEVGREADTNGQTVTLEGEYIWRKRLGVRMTYEYISAESDSVVLTSHFDNFPGGESSFSDETAQHSLYPEFSLFAGGTLAVKVGGRFSWVDITRAYESAANHVDYLWNWRGVSAAVSYDITRHLGCGLEYAYAKRGGDVTMTNREKGKTYRSTFDIESQEQQVSIEITGRF